MKIHAQRMAHTASNDDSDHASKLAETKERLSSPAPIRNARNSRSSSSTTVYWIKDQRESVDPPPNADSVPYVQIYTAATQQRQSAQVGQCPYDMRVLYNFWSHFLLRNFNKNMYTHFRSLALDDANNGSSFGMDHLLEYYHEALFSHDRPVRKAVARDFVDLARDEEEQGIRRAFNRLRTAWRNGEMNLKSRKILQDAMDTDLKSSVDC